jgi:hypothetical protein
MLSRRLKMPEKKEAIFSKSVKGGTRTYFIDVRETVKGDKYLSICESKKVDGKWERNSILFFGDSIREIFQALREASQALKG